MQETTRKFSPDDVITALLFYLPQEFSNDPEKIHRKIYELKHKEKYKELLEDFEFLDYPRFPYSPLLGRIFNRLQESKLLSSLNPDYIMYQIKPDSKKAINSYYLKKDRILYKQRGKLKEIAGALKKEL